VDVSVALEAFYASLLHEVEEFVRRPSTNHHGAAVVLKRVAKVHGGEIADRLPLPRSSRAERQDRADTR
jgi:hypothetical protein